MMVPPMPQHLDSMSESPVTAVSVRFSRCICWHGIAEKCDAVLQFILPDSNIIPCSMGEIMQEVDGCLPSGTQQEKNTGGVVKFMDGFDDDSPCSSLSTATTDSEDCMVAQFRKTLNCLSNDIKISRDPSVCVLQENSNSLPATVNVFGAASVCCSFERCEAENTQENSKNRQISEARKDAINNPPPFDFPLPVRRRKKGERKATVNPIAGHGPPQLRRRPKGLNSLKLKQQFLEGYKQLQRGISEAFRSHNRGKVEEILVAIGPTVHTYKEQIRIKWPTGCYIANGECRCAEGQPISDREFDHVGLSLIGQLGAFKKPKLAGNSGRRVFVWILAKESAVLPGFYRDETFRPVEGMLAVRRKMRTINVKFKHGRDCLSRQGRTELIRDHTLGVEGGGRDSMESIEEREDLAWFKFGRFIQGFK